MKLSYKIVKKYFTCILFLLCLSFPKCILAQPLELHPRILQDLGQVATPQATDLGRFGDIPMSYYTGRANVTIPIKSYTYNGVTLDINLSYDTSGLKMNQLPGWAGPGWTLNAGGCITRVQKYHCDEMEFGTTLNITFSNYFHSYGDLSSYNSNTIVNQSVFKDYEADLFYFNFMGKTGFFFLGDDGQWKVSSDCNLAVEFNVNDSTNFIDPPISTYPAPSTFHNYNQPKAIKGFTIYDDEGNQYLFGFTPNAIEYSMDYFMASDTNDRYPWVATSWYLTEVKDHFGNVLYSLSYWRGKFTAQFFKHSYTSNKKRIGAAYYDINIHNPYFYSGTLHLPVYLHQIHTYGGDYLSFMTYAPYEVGTAYRHLYPSLYNPNGVEYNISREGTFTQAPYIYLQVRGDSLDKYRVVNDDGLYTHPLSALDFQLLKSITIGNGPSGYTCELDYDSLSRIHLSKVSMTITDISSIIPDTIQQYTLKYNNYQGVPQDYLTEAFDHWGYYRDPNASGNTIQQRASNFSYTMQGALTEIGYPTGGRSVLEYELNTYNGVLTDDRQVFNSGTNYSGNAGGLRVKTITEYDSSTSSQIVRRRTFNYNNPTTNTTSGQLFQTPRYSWFWTYNGNEMSVSQSVPVLPLTGSLGTHIGYSYVTETTEDGCSHRYHFSNFSDEKDELPIYNVSTPAGATPYARFGELGNMRGKLLEEIVKDSNQIIFQTKTYTYRQDEASFKGFASKAANIKSLFDTHDVGHIYKIYYFKYDLQNIITNTRQGNVFVSDTVSYEMGDFTNNVLFPTYFRKCISERVARGSDNVQKNYTYRTLSHDLCYMPLTTTSVYNGGVLQRTNKTIFRVSNNHDVPHYETTWISSGFKDTLITYNSFSDSGLPTKITRKGEPPTRFFWNSKGKLLASVTSSYIGYLQCTELIKNNDNPASQPELSPLNVIKRNGTTIFDYPDTKATANIYYNNGLLYMSATDNGSYQYYYYDQLGRLTEIRDQNKKVIQRFTYNYSSSSAQ